MTIVWAQNKPNGSSAAGISHGEHGDAHGEHGAIHGVHRGCSLLSSLASWASLVTLTKKLLSPIFDHST